MVFLSGRTNEEGGSERGVHDRMSAEVDNEWKQRLAQAFAWRTRHKAPQPEAILPRKSAFCVHKVGFDVSIWSRVRSAVFFFVVHDSFYLSYCVRLSPSGT